MCSTAEVGATLRQSGSSISNFCAFASQYTRLTLSGWCKPDRLLVIFQLPLNEISDPVKSPYGYHLFMVDRKRGAGLRPFVVVKEEIADLLYQTKEETAFQQWFKQLRVSTQTRVDWDQIDNAIHR